MRAPGILGTAPCYVLVAGSCCASSFAFSDGLSHEEGGI